MNNSCPWQLAGHGGSESVAAVSMGAPAASAVRGGEGVASTDHRSAATYSHLQQHRQWPARIADQQQGGER